MKIQCQISGEIFYSSYDFSDDTNEKPLSDYHPIFRVSSRSLLAKARNYGRGLYSLQEERLLFLALLHKTEHIIWTVPAYPRPQVVKNNIEKAFSLLSWISNINPGGKTFPSLRVSLENQSLDTINSFFTAWNLARQEYMAPKHLAELAEQQEAREFVIHKLIHSFKDTNTYAGRLAKWAMDACEIEDEDLRAEYTELFMLKDDRIFGANLDELIGLMNTLQQKLFAVKSYGETRQNISATVLNHIQRIIDIKKGGYMMQLTGSGQMNSNLAFRIQKPANILNDESNLDDEEAIIKDGIEQIFKDLNVSVTYSAPTIDNYKGDIKLYVRARAAWINSEDLRADLDILNERKLKKFGV